MIMSTDPNLDKAIYDFVSEVMNCHRCWSCKDHAKLIKRRMDNAREDNKETDETDDL